MAILRPIHTKVHVCNTYFEWLLHGRKAVTLFHQLRPSFSICSNMQKGAKKAISRFLTDGAHIQDTGIIFSLLGNFLK